MYFQRPLRFITSILTLLFFSVPLSLSAQSTIKLNPIKWDKIDKLEWGNTTIPAKYSTEDRVVFRTLRKVVFNTDRIGTGYTDKVDIVHSIHKPLTQEGVANIADNYIYLREGEDLINFQVRIIKSSGEIQEFNPETLPMSKYKFNKYKNELVKEVAYSIPNVALGDILETYETIQDVKWNFIEYFFPENTAPVFLYTTKIIHDDNLSTTVQAYHTSNEIEKREWTSRYSFTVDFDSLEVYNNDRFSIRPLEVPHVLFHARSIGYPSSQITLVKETWKELLLDVKKEHNYRNTSRKEWYAFERTMDNLLRPYSHLSPIEKLEKCIAFCNKNLTVRTVSKLEENMCSGYFISKGYISPKAYRRLNAQLLDYLGLEYSIAVARDRYYGPAPFLSSAFYTDNFLVTTVNGQYYFLFPNDFNNKYLLNEIPLYLRNTNAIFFENNSVKKIKTLEISSLGYKLNKRVNRLLISDFDSNPRIKQTSELKYEVNTAFRNQIKRSQKLHSQDRVQSFISLEESDSLLSFEVDSTSSLESFTYSSQTKLAKSLVNEIETNLFQLNLSKVIDPIQYEMSDSKRTLAVFMPYGYTDLYNINLKLEKPINLQNEDNTLVNFSNKIGEVKSTAISLGSIINIQIVIKLKEPTISAEDYELLLSFNEAIESTKNVSILYSTQPK